MGVISMATDIMSVRTPFFPSDLPKAMSGLSTGNPFHFDKQGNKLYKFDKNSRYKFAESVQRALREVDTIDGWDQFVLLLYSLTNKTWYARKVNELYQQRTGEGADEDLNQRLFDIIKDMSKYRSQCLPVLAILPEETDAEPSNSANATPVRQPVSLEKFTLSEKTQSRTKVYSKLNNKSAPAWGRLAVQLCMDADTLKEQIDIWKRTLPPAISKCEDLGELLHNPMTFQSFSLYKQLGILRGVGHKEIQQGFENFFQREVQLRLDQ